MFLLRKRLGREFAGAGLLAVVHRVLVEAGIARRTRPAEHCRERLGGRGLEQTSSSRAGVTASSRNNTDQKKNQNKPVQTAPNSCVAKYLLGLVPPSVL